MNRKEEIEPVNTDSLSKQVEKSLREFIKKNGLKPGDPLPREVELAESLNVSRTVVREAISRLRSYGLINTRKHKGMTVGSPDIMKTLSNTMDPRLMEKGTLKEIFELRLMLEVGMSRFLIERITEEDLCELEDIAANEARTTGLEFNIKHEVEFHGKLYKIAGNTTLMGLQDLLIPVFRFVHERYLDEGHEFRESEVKHSDIVRVLQNRNVADYEEIMRLHLEPHFNNVC